MVRTRQLLTMAASTAVLAGSLTVASPGYATQLATQDAAPRDSLARMSGALVAEADIPKNLGSWRQSDISSGTDDREQPDVCPTSRKQELDQAKAWSATTYSGVDAKGANRQVAVESKIWEYDSDSSVRRSPADALRNAIDCKNRSRVIAGKRLAHKSARTGGDSARQLLTVTSTKSTPRLTRIATSWRISGRYLVNVSVVRYGKQATKKGAKADLLAAKALSAVSASKLDNPTELQPEEPPVYPDAPSAQLQGPAQAPWVVSLGDSYISGEGGAWAGNVENSLFDSAVYRGAQTYFDNPNRTAELIPMCHRSDSAAIHIGVARSLNLACSGATTKSATNADGDWKPGIDFGYQKNGPGRGQAAMLEEFAKDNPVGMVALSIGGNDFEFAKIVESCVKDFLFSPYIWSTYCSEDKDIKAKVNDTRVNEMADRIAGAIGNIQTAMSNAGYSQDQWKLVVQNYPSPLPRGNKIRYWQTLLRQSDGGCGFWNRDADWANDYVLPQVNKAVRQAIVRSKATNALALDLSQAFVDNRLCEDGTVSVDTLAANKWTPWTPDGKFEAREWVMQIRAVSDSYSDAQKTESFHPNYLGQLAVRNCMRQVYENQRGGQCVREDRSLNTYGEPNMVVR